MEEKQEFRPAGAGGCGASAPSDPLSHAGAAESPAEFLHRLGDSAEKWAEAFCAMYPAGPDFSVMIGWFANAIEHSSDVRRSEQIHDDEALLNHLDTVMWQRRFMRELALSSEAEA